MTKMEKINKVLTSLKERDFVRFLEYFFRLLRKVGVSLSLDFLYLEDAALARPTPETDFELTLWNRHNFLGSIPWIDQKKYEIFSQRIKLGNSAYLIGHRGKIIGYRWISTDKNIFPREKIINYFPDNTIYFYDAYISPEFRGKGLFAFSTARMIRDHQEKGIKIGSVSSFFNKSAQRAKEKARAKKTGLILSVKLLNRWEFTKKLKSYPAETG